MKLRDLTPKQRKFVDNLMLGYGPSDAYRRVYGGSMSARSINVESGKLVRLPHVAAYLAERRAKSEAKVEMTREFLLEQLRGIIEASRPGDRIRAIAQASRMLGYDAPQKVEGVAGGEPISIRWMS